MVDVLKCLEFKTLQWDINHDIDHIGYTTIAKADRLDELVNELSKEDMDFILDWKD